MLGDHIRALKDGRWLHGIDLGDQRVLYLQEAPGLAPGDRLRRVYRPEFTAGASKVELVVHREPSYPSKAVVARAWSRFMDPSVIAMFRDSESFAAWCKIGRLPEAAPAEPALARATRSAAPAATTKLKAPNAKRPKVKAAPAAKKATASTARKAAVKKSAPKKAVKKPAARKAPGKKAPARHAAPRKAAGKKPAARKAAPQAKKAPAKKKGRR